MTPMTTIFSNTCLNDNFMGKFTLSLNTCLTTYSIRFKMFEKKPKPKKCGFEPYRWVFTSAEPHVHGILVRTHNFTQQCQIRLWQDKEEIMTQVREQLGLAQVHVESVEEKTSQYIR